MVKVRRTTMVMWSSSLPRRTIRLPVFRPDWTKNKNTIRFSAIFPTFVQDSFKHWGYYSITTTRIKYNLNLHKHTLPGSVGWKVRRRWSWGPAIRVSSSYRTEEARHSEGHSLEQGTEWSPWTETQWYDQGFSSFGMTDSTGLQLCFKECLRFTSTRQCGRRSACLILFRTSQGL